MDKMEKITVCIVNYNTPELTAAAVRSLWKHHPNCRIVVFDNSDRLPSGGLNRFNRQIEIVDNTKGQIIDFDSYLQQFPNKETGSVNKSNYGSTKHALSVQWMIDNTDEPFVLMDSDVLVFQSINCFCNPRYAFVAHIGCNTYRRFGLEIYRAEPLLCYINAPMLRKYGIRYFNPDYMWALSNVSPNNRYDTGAWLLKDVQEHNLPYLDVDTSHYILHFGHGSWKEKDYRQWLEWYRDLWQ